MDFSGIKICSEKLVIHLGNLTKRFKPQTKNDPLTAFFSSVKGGNM